MSYFKGNIFNMFLENVIPFFFPKTLNTIFTIYRDGSFQTSKCENKHLSNTILKINNSTLELENDFKLINIVINDIDKLEKKRSNKEESIYKKYLVRLVN